MRIQMPCNLLLFAALSVASLAGCQPVSSGSASIGENQLKVLGILYGKFIRLNRGQAPASEEEFVAYLESTPASWNKMVGTAQELLKSPRDGQPLTLVYGGDLDQQTSEGTIWVGYEQAGGDGMFRVVSARGNIARMDEQELRKFFP